MNFIDTSWNYSVGGAERALGVLRELVSLGKLEREEVVVVSGGLPQGSCSEISSSKRRLSRWRPLRAGIE